MKPIWLPVEEATILFKSKNNKALKEKKITEKNEIKIKKK